MSRLIYIPQFPQKMRYQEFFITEFTKEFKKHFDEVITLGESYIDTFMESMESSGMFASINNSIYFELNQIVEFNKLKLYSDDTLFLGDLSFPGFFCNILYHNNIKNSYAYCHATSLNKNDYFSGTRYSKFPCETSHSKLFKKVFVGSEYHKKKLGWNNIEVIGLPIPPFKSFASEKKYDIISVCRPNKQKITKSIENKIEKDFGKIVRQECNTWEQYYKFLSEGKVLLITSKEDTFNYTILEAIMNRTTPLAPNRCSYSELLSSEYIYLNYDDLRNKIWQVLNGQLNPPQQLKNQDLVDNFYKNLIYEMV